MPIYTATTDGQTFTLNETDDTVVLGSYNNVVVDNGLAFRFPTRGPSYETISLGSGTGDFVETYIDDLVIGASDSGSATFRSVGVGNTFDLGNGTFNATLANGNGFTAGSGANTVIAGTSDTVTLGDGNNTITGGAYGLISLGGGSNTITLANYETLSVGNGANWIGNGGQNDVIEVGDGNNYVSLAANNTLTAGNGNNTIDGGFNNAISLGAGNKHGDNQRW
jgi:hypothetical protein